MKHLVQFELEMAVRFMRKSTSRRTLSNGVSASAVMAMKKPRSASSRPSVQFNLPPRRCSDLARVGHANEITLEFGIKLNGTLGAIFATVNSEANFKVSLKWAKRT